MPEDASPNVSPMEVIPSKELKILYTWKAPSRSFKRRDKEFWTTVISIVFLVGLILFFVKEWFLIAAIISLTFVYYVLSTVEPEEVEHKITNRGLIYAGQTYAYENISQFWFSEKNDQKVINFELVGGGLVGRITLMIGSGEQGKIKEILLKYLIEEEVKPNFLDNASKWLAEKVPLESEKKPVSSNPSK
jgi:hypothetical protein